MSSSRPSCVIFPSFPVTDGSWGPVWLNISDKCGLLIECKQTGNILESWKWNETSHVTIKKVSTFLVQAKKHNGVKKLLSFSNMADLDRFIRVLHNAVSILSVFNIKRQRKFVVIQPAPPTNFDKSAHYEVAVPKINLNSNVHGTGEASAMPPPPPPPPPMMVPKTVNLPKAQAIKPKKVTIESSDVLKELFEGFSKGILKPSEIAKKAGTNGKAKSPTEDQAEMVELGEETRKLA